jgi:hypothetical protein
MCYENFNLNVERTLASNACVISPHCGERALMGGLYVALSFEIGGSS